MKRKLYTRSHDLSLLRKVDANGAQLTAEESKFLAERELEAKFASKDELVRWYLGENAAKLGALGYAIETVKRKGYRSVVSFGAGPCVLEYLLRLSLPADGQVFALDFNEFFVSRAKALFPELVPIRFDFFHDGVTDVPELRDAGGIDLAVFFGSAYVLDDSAFVTLFRELKEKLGVKEIIDFHSGFLDTKACVRSLFLPIKKSPTLMRLIGKGSDYYIGKFHGYGRSRSSLEKLYARAGFPKVHRQSIGSYPYVASLN